MFILSHKEYQFELFSKNNLWRYFFEMRYSCAIIFILWFTMANIYGLIFWPPYFHITWKYKFAFVSETVSKRVKWSKFCSATGLLHTKIQYLICLPFDCKKIHLGICMHLFDAIILFLVIYTFDLHLKSPIKDLCSRLLQIYIDNHYSIVIKIQIYPHCKDL